MKKVYRLIIILLLIAVDQLSKIKVVNNFILGEEKEIIKNVFSFEYIRNTGAAWGMFPNGTIFFAIFSIIICSMLLVLLFRIPNNRRYNLLSFTICLLIAGAVGNLIDRGFRHYVVDFFYFKPIDFPIFNIADIYITISAVGIILLIMFYYKDEDFDFMKIHFNRSNNIDSNIVKNKAENIDNSKDN